MASITEVARLAGVSPATASRVVSASDYPVSAATRARVLEAARTLDYVPERARPRPAQELRAGGRGHGPRHHRPLLRRGRPRRRGRGVVGRLPRDHLQLRARRGPRAVVRPAAALDPRGGRRLRRHPASTTRSRTRRWTATSRRCAPTAPRSSTSRRTRLASRRSASTTRPGWRRWSRRWSGSGTADRVPRRAGVAVRGPGAARGLPARARGRRDRARRPARGPHDGFDARGRGAGAVDALLAGDAPFTAICCANDLLALGALQRLAELGIDVPGAVSVAGFDDISDRRHHGSRACPPCGSRCASSAGAGSSTWTRAGRRRAGARAPADELVLRESTRAGARPPLQPAREVTRPATPRSHGEAA